CENDPDNDADGDGVCGDADACPDTAPGEPVDEQGCSAGQLDPDQDGVPSGEDNCPNDSNPNQEDTDQDGVGDVCDACPGSDDTQDVDADGLPDDCDDCPFDPDNDADGDGVCGDVDICLGFDDAIDADSDGIPDGCDDCPNDPDNDADGDGVCGDVDACPGFDDNQDSDGDGTPDGCDECPFDPDNDADGDGVCGNLDQCPDTPKGIQVDDVGCPSSAATWTSTRRLSTDYVPPDQYAFDQDGVMTSADVTPNVRTIESNSNGGTVTVIDTVIPLGVPTTVYQIEDFLTAGGALVQTVTVDEFTLSLDGQQATWTLRYSVVNDVELPGSDPSSESTEFDAVMTGQVSVDGFEITFTEVTGNRTRCELFGGGCDTRPLESDEFGEVTWMRIQ
ncbi:MAG: thrombospondin type 3 repeat-containing protein, partial [Planctomycetes bacterium]|nr:thrombospondin type 3 repeat-containing protein [Planctomycetota bacterium]